MPNPSERAAKGWGNLGEQLEVVSEEEELT